MFKPWTAAADTLDSYSSDEETGCRVGNCLTINEDETVHAEFKSGQASFHHGRLLHASAPNHSDERRIGFAVNYIAPHVRQAVASEDFAILVRSKDRQGNFTHVPLPQDNLSEDALAWHNRILTTQNQAMYDGAQDAER